MPSVTGKSRSTVSRPVRGITRTKAAAITPDDLATDIAKKLTISRTRSKVKPDAPQNGKGKLPSSSLTDDDRRKSAMQVVNTASQYLSAAVDNTSTSSRARHASDWAKKGRDALRELREIGPGQIDTERAASSIIGKVVSLGIDDAALAMLQDMRNALIALYRNDEGSQRQEGASPLLSLPLPLEDTRPSGIILTLSATYLLHSLTIYCRNAANLPVLLDALQDRSLPTLLVWTPHLAHLPEKQHDALFTRAYTSLAKMLPPPGARPEDIFQIKKYALFCLAYTRQGVIVPDTFWGQAVKWTRAYISSSHAGSSPQSTADCILGTLDDLILCVQKRQDSELFLRGMGFTRFCEIWTVWAKQISDLGTLDKILALIRGSGGKNDSASASSSSARDLADASEYANKASPEDLMLEAVTICTSLAQVSTIFEQWPEHSVEDKAKCLRDAIGAVQSSKTFIIISDTRAHSHSIYKDIREKVRRALERLRRTLIVILEPSPDGKRDGASSPAQLILDARIVLEEIASELVDATQSGDGNGTKFLDTDLITPALDTLLVLARTVLAVRNPDTYGKAWDILQQAKAFIMKTELGHYSGTQNRAEGIALDIPHEECDIASRAAAHANYVRCLSGAFHNIAGTLYQADRISHATRFLIEGCELGRQALVMHRKYLERSQTACVNESERESEGWKQLEEQIWRRWEVLGVCQAKIGDRKLAFDAWLQSIKSFPFQSVPFMQQLQASTISSAFASSAMTRQLSAILDRVTYMAACELFLEPRLISAKSFFENTDSTMKTRSEEASTTDYPLDSSHIVGALLERQIISLIDSRGKQGVPGILRQMLHDALEIYSAHATPIRRARILLIILQLDYESTAGEERNSVKGISVQQIGEQTKTLLSADDCGTDSNLKRFRTEYSMKLHLWLALQEHKCAVSDPQAFPRVIQHTEEACQILRTLLAQGPRRSGGRPSREHAHNEVKSPKEKCMGTRKAPKKATAVAKSRMTKPRAHTTKASKIAEPPTTPKRRGALDDLAMNTPPIATQRQQPTSNDTISIFDDFAQLMSLLQTTATVLGLLGHILAKVRLLNLARKLSSQLGQYGSKDHVVVSMELAHAYLKLGKAEKASGIYSRILSNVRSGSLAPEICSVFFLRYAESLATAGQLPISAQVYREAATLSGSIILESKGLTTLQRVRQRVATIERAAIASAAFSAIQYTRDEPSIYLEGLLRSLRLWNRALDTTSKLHPSSVPKAEESDNPFEIKQTDEQGHPREQLGRQSTLRPRSATESSEWRIVEGLLDTLFTLSQAYYARGSPREAEYFVQQASDLARTMNIPGAISRALARNGETLLRLGRLEEGWDLVVQATDLVANISAPDTADICRLRAEYNQRNAQHSDARQLYEEATMLLDELGRTLSTLDRLSIRKSTPSSRLSAGLSTGDALAPTILAAILSRHISLLRDAGEECTVLLDRIASLPPSAETKTERSVLLARLTLDDAYSQFRADMFLSSLAESAIIIPMGMISERHTSSPSIAQEILNLLSTAEASLWADLTLIARRGNVPQVRETSISLALIIALRCSLGLNDQMSATIVSRLIDASTAITLRREMMEAIEHKFIDPICFDDLQWPIISEAGVALRRVGKHLSTRGDLFDDSDNEDALVGPPQLRTYWDAIYSRYKSQSLCLSDLATTRAIFPSNWTIFNISVTEDKSTIFVTRERAHTKTLVFCLPLKGRRENEGEEHLAYHDVMKELEEILHLNDEGTKRASGVRSGDKSARAAWWADRSALDKRLQDLLQNIEFCWFGAFKTILNASVNIPAETIEFLRSRVEKIFTASLLMREKKRIAHVKLSDILLECFALLPLDCRDEEMEDLVYFVLDLYQLHGVSVAIAEIDVDQVVIDLRSVLQECSAKKGQGTALNDSHIFLVLDKNVQMIPWESLPTLRGQSVIRIPNLDFLMDRIELAQQQRDSRMSTSLSPETQRPVVDRISLDPRKTYYVLNPSGDLKATETRFAGWVKDMKSVGWNGVIGRAPSEQELADALSRNDFVIYFGHGGAEQYIRSSKIRHLSRCAATMLWGCSSGALKDMGDFDRIGTPLNYMLAGCPTLVANLWDVTDRDIDKFSKVVFDDLKLDPEGVKESRCRENSVSIVKAIAGARECVKLKYLTGAAPVIYGIPFYL